MKPWNALKIGGILSRVHTHSRDEINAFCLRIKFSIHLSAAENARALINLRKNTYKGSKQIPANLNLDGF